MSPRILHRPIAAHTSRKAGSFFNKFLVRSIAVGCNGSLRSRGGLAVHLFGDAFYGVVGGEGCAFLPADEVGEVVSGEVGSALRLF